MEDEAESRGQKHEGRNSAGGREARQQQSPFSRVHQIFVLPERKYPQPQKHCLSINTGQHVSKTADYECEHAQNNLSFDPWNSLRLPYSSVIPLILILLLFECGEATMI